MSETALIIKMQQSGKEHQQFGVSDKTGHILASPVFAQDGDEAIGMWLWGTGTSDGFAATVLCWWMKKSLGCGGMKNNTLV